MYTLLKRRVRSGRKVSLCICTTQCTVNRGKSVTSGFIPHCRSTELSAAFLSDSLRVFVQHPAARSRFSQPLSALLVVRVVKCRVRPARSVGSALCETDVSVRSGLVIDDTSDEKIRKREKKNVHFKSINFYCRTNVWLIWKAVILSYIDCISNYVCLVFHAM